MSEQNGFDESPTSGVELAPNNSLPRYDLDPDEIIALTRRLTAEFPASTDSTFNRYSCYGLDGTNQFSNLARSVEVTVFQEQFGNSPSDMNEGYNPFETASGFFLVVDQQEGLPVGALRYIKNSDAGMKTLNDTESHFGISVDTIKANHGIENLDDCWDIGTVAVLKKYREGNSDHIISTSLYRALYATALEEHVKHFVAIMDKGAYNQLTKILGVPFVPISGTSFFEYMGSEESLPTYGNVDTFHDKVKANKESLNPSTLKLFGKYIDRLLLGTEVPEVTKLN